MRVVAQRVSAGQRRGRWPRSSARIGRGLLLLVGIEKGDGEKEIAFMAEKVLNLRIFADAAGQDEPGASRTVGGEILSISQFTLAARSKKGRRPDFSDAEEPGRAEELYDALQRPAGGRRSGRQPGMFGAMMDVRSVNQRPGDHHLGENSRDERG